MIGRQTGSNRAFAQALVRSPYFLPFVLCCFILFGVGLFYSYVSSTSTGSRELEDIAEGSPLSPRSSISLPPTSPPPPLENTVPPTTDIKNTDTESGGAILQSTISTSKGKFRPDSDTTKVYSYNIVNKFPHDPQAFTQGLVIDDDGTMYEGTGLKGRSSLRKVNKETGEVLKIHNINEKYFGEGIAIFKDKIYQLTWQEHVGIIYDKRTWNQLKTWNHKWEGWGITHDGTNLIVSDGSDALRFLDPETLEEIRSIHVRDKAKPISQLNELEYIDGEIYANVWQTQKIAIIDPATGSVKAWLDLSNILSAADRGSHYVDVLNGIAFDQQKRKLYVTGKMWPKLYEIELVATVKGKKRT